MKKQWDELQRLFIDPDVLRKAAWCVPLFYYILEFMTFQQLMRYEQLGRVTAEPLWPVFWVGYLGGYAAFTPHIFLILLTAATTLGAAFYRYRTARVFVFLAVMQYQAYIMSLFNQEHDYYIPLFVSLFLIFLPNVWRGAPPLEERRRFLVIFWGAQAYILLTYTMSGFYKIVTFFGQFASGGAHYFSRDAAALYVAFWQMQFERTSVLGDFIVEHQMLSSLGLIAVLYILTFSIFVTARPRIHRAWGIALLAFHLSTVVSLGIIFIYNVLFVAAFFLLSPFAPEKNGWREMLRDLPIIGFIARAIL